MASVNGALLASVKKFRDAELELIEARRVLDSTRREMATMFSRASSTQPISGLSRITGIKRTTIYWLINNWSTGEDTDSND